MKIFIRAERMKDLHQAPYTHHLDFVTFTILALRHIHLFIHPSIHPLIQPGFGGCIL